MENMSQLFWPSLSPLDPTQPWLSGPLSLLSTPFPASGLSGPVVQSIAAMGSWANTPPPQFLQLAFTECQALCFPALWSFLSEGKNRNTLESKCIQ